MTKNRLNPSPIRDYLSRALSALRPETELQLEKLVTALLDAWANDRNVFLCGNGGSAANAVHLANDFLHGLGVRKGKGQGRFRCWRFAAHHERNGSRGRCSYLGGRMFGLPCCGGAGREGR